MFKNFEQEFVIKEDPKIRITAKLSRTVSFEFNYIDQNTGQILIKNKAKLDTKGKNLNHLLVVEFSEITIILNSRFKKR